jgi:hypothetical protein
MKGLRARRLSVSLAAASLITAFATYAIARDGFGGVFAVAPGMTQNDLQSVMGPPDYIQVRYTQQAWQYCPGRWFDRDKPFVTVWMRDFRVEHLRTYPSGNMGRCEDFISAFRWEDRDGFGAGFGALK